MTDLCGWEDHQCLYCPYCENDKCYFSEELRPLIEWLYSLMRERDRMNPFGWGANYRQYFHRSRQVYEFLIYDFPDDKKEKLWEVWKDGAKDSIKKLGFFITKVFSDWILFWDFKYEKILLEFLEVSNDRERD